MQIFLHDFDEDNLQAANDSLQEVIVAYGLSNSEKVELISRISKYLRKKNISLDCLTTY